MEKILGAISNFWDNIDHLHSTLYELLKFF